MDPTENQAHQAGEQYVDDAPADRLKDGTLPSSNAPPSNELNARCHTGPVGQAVQSEAAKITTDFKDLSAAKSTPQQPAATGQPLTRISPLKF
jgi:hypothetical protein